MEKYEYEYYKDIIYQITKIKKLWNKYMDVFIMLN